MCGYDNEAAGIPCYCDDLPQEPIELWDFENDWRGDCGDIDALRINRSELLADDLQEAAELEEERRRLGTL